MDTRRGIRAAQTALVVNSLLVVVKMAAGILGHTYALIADAVESSTDIFSSLIVWAGLQVASQSPDESHPYGHGKAEAIASAVVALMLLGGAVAIAIGAVHEIVTPHRTPAPFTLIVIAVVVLIKEILFRKVSHIGVQTGSIAVQTDAWHQRSDAITSAAAFIGIAIALWGGPGWESADDWAALFASFIIAATGLRFLRAAVDDLMDKVPEQAIVTAIEAAAHTVPGVRATEKLRVRKLGADYLVDLHVQADPSLSLHDAHVISGKVKSAIREAVPRVKEVLIHMEPYEQPSTAHGRVPSAGR
jgi:cation diffusion facilitator family transporter